jgi:hypothetical protein
MPDVVVGHIEDLESLEPVFSELNDITPASR